MSGSLMIEFRRPGERGWTVGVISDRSLIAHKLLTSIWYQDEFGNEYRRRTAA